ncbi:Uncharacterised protein [uncultured archaeon]|nr:Uncharacterised protein [uncultured archaeon]
MVLFGEFDKILLLFFIVVLGTIFAFSFNVDVTKSYHDARQIAIGTESILGDNNALLAKYGGTGVVTCLDGNVLVWSSSANSWKCGKNLMSLTDVNNIVVAASGGTGLISCQDGNVLKWSGAQSKWVCGDNASSGVLGTGTTNKIAKWAAQNTIGDSQISDDGITVRVVGDICTSAGGGKCLSQAQTGPGLVVGGGVDKRADGWNANCKPWGVAYCDAYQNLTCPVSTTRISVGSTYIPFNNKVPETWLPTYICITN